MKRLARARQTLLHLALALSLAATLAAFASLAPTSPFASSCAGAGSYHAAIVVAHGDGAVVSRCVAFDTAEISGEELLNLSGISWSGQTFSFGVAVCALDGEPAQYGECLGADRYWALFEARSVAAGGSWQMASTGLSGLAIHDGDAVGFRYVPISGTPAEPPSPAAVCALATQAPSASAPSTAGPSQTPAARAPAPSGSSGPDLGLLVAAAAALALIGLAVLRLIVRRR